MSESNIRFWPTWYSHRGVKLWSQTPTFLGNAQITLLLRGATGTQKNTSRYHWPATKNRKTVSACQDGSTNSYPSRLALTKGEGIYTSWESGERTSVDGTMN